MASGKNYHKHDMCKECGKVFRDDYLKRHKSTKHVEYLSKVADNGSLVVTLKRRPVDQEDGKDVQDKEMDEKFKIPSLEFKLLRNNDSYIKNVEIGRQIAVFLSQGKILEPSLAKEHKYCLQLFRAQNPTMNATDAKPKLWQWQILDIIEQEGEWNNRKIIWVKGEQGNEGKSWLQSYIQSRYGTHRVIRFDITNKTSDLLHIMSRCPLETIDIFLFNHQRCISSEECCYSLLEMIKDGYASAPKFHGALLKIKTPNVVIVFSNRNPKIQSLSKDRWKIFFITQDGLTAGHEEMIWKAQKNDCTFAPSK